jgi:hypothetical protein
MSSGEPSCHGGKHTISKVSDESNATLDSLRNIIKGQNTISLKELYEKNDEVHQVSNFTLIAHDPVNCDDVVKKEVWVEFMNQEIDAIERNNTWELVDLLEDKNCIGVKWIYKTKLNVEGEVEEHKARLGAQGFSEQPDINYNETFSPVVRLDIVRMVLSIDAHNKWCMY